MKLFLTLFFTIFIVACASTSDVDSLRSDVDAIKLAQETHSVTLKDLSLEQEIINGKLASIEKSNLKIQKEHEKLLEKMNRIFTISQTK